MISRPEENRPGVTIICFTHPARTYTAGVDLPDPGEGTVGLCCARELLAPLCLNERFVDRLLESEPRTFHLVPIIPSSPSRQVYLQVMISNGMCSCHEFGLALIVAVGVQGGARGEPVNEYALLWLTGFLGENASNRKSLRFSHRFGVNVFFNGFGFVYAH